MAYPDLPNSPLHRRSSRSSTKNQRGRMNDSAKREKSRFPWVSRSSSSPSSSAVSSMTPSSSSNDVDSARDIISSLSVRSPCSNSLSYLPAVSPPTNHSRRSPPPGSCPEMATQSSSTLHTFSVMLPRTILPEMITVSAKKGDRLDVVADAWHMEHDCHYGWEIGFAPGDADMSTVRAKLNPDGELTIEVRRRPLGQTCLPPTGMGPSYSL